MAHTVPGSSPHTRGTLRVPCCRRWHIRFIPAYAGNAHFCTCWHIACPVYPRIRGERRAEVVAVLDADGSSPHARGTHHADNRRSWRGRFIPACAGNAPPCHAPMMARPVHPRMRGERLAQRGRTGSLGGSSPHARGTRTSGCPGRLSAPVHPRMRGERGLAAQKIEGDIGSSPHARGTRSDIYNSIMTRRFIPACAGNARPGRQARSRLPVHPRMRGERSAHVVPMCRAIGSSPHARGTRSSSGWACASNRFIPACAGNARGDTAGTCP